jgi:GntR family transcriptional regulator
VATEEPLSRTEQVADDLRTAINRGDYPRGSQLPSEDELARRYGVARSVINTAMRGLRAEGLVRAERGRGTIVTEIPEIHRYAMVRYARQEREHGVNRGPFDAEIRRMGMKPHVDVDVRAAPSSPEIAAGLQIPPGQPVVIRERKMYADGTPVQFATSYIPAEIAEGTRIAQMDSGPGGIISRFAELGYAQVRITETIRQRPPSAVEREFLRLDKGQAVLEVVHIGWTAAGRPVEYSINVVPAWQWRLDYEWQMD